MTLAALGAAWLWLIVAATAARAVFTRKGRFLGRAFLWNLPREILRRLWNIGRRANEPLESHLNEVLPRLLRSGFAGAEIRVSPKDGGRELVFGKYFRSAGETGLALCIDADALIPEQVRTIEADGAARGLAWKREAQGERDVLMADCGADVPAAVALGDYLWREVFGLPVQALRRVRETGISAWGEPVTRPDQAHLSDQEGTDYWREEVNEQIRHRDEERACEGNSFPKIGCRPLARTVGAGVTLIAMVAGALWSYGGTAEWHIEVAGHGLGGNYESLIFFACYLFFLIPGSWIVGPWPQRRDWRSWPWAFKARVYWDRVVLWTAPLAVVLIWSGG